MQFYRIIDESFKSEVSKVDTRNPSSFILNPDVGSQLIRSVADTDPGSGAF
jgi:hypothetical protein